MNREGGNTSSGRAWGVIRSVLRQTLKGMSRRLTAQWVTVGSVAAMQSIFAATLLLAFNLDELAEQWERGGDVLVFLKPGISSVDQERIATITQSWDGVHKITLRTPEDAIIELQRSLGSDLLDAEVSAEILPATLEVDFDDESTVEDQLKMRARLLSLPEVNEVEAVIEGRGLLAQLYALREWIGVWRWAIGVWVGLSVAFVLNQFVRLNLYQRRREVEVLEAVGASRAFILSPLMIEGGIQSALGSMAALGLVERLLSSQESGTLMMTELLQFTPQPLSWELSVAFVLGSMSLGAIASWRAANAFLRRDV